MDAEAKMKLFRAKLKAQMQEKQRIDSPLVRYNEHDQLVCKVCDVVIKSDSLWPAHQVSRKHQEAIDKLKANASALNRANNSKHQPPKELPKPKSESYTELHDKSESSTALPKQRSSMLPPNFFDNHETKRQKKGRFAKDQNEYSGHNDHDLFGQFARAHQDLGDYFLQQVYRTALLRDESHLLHSALQKSLLEESKLRSHVEKLNNELAAARDGKRYTPAVEESLVRAVAKKSVLEVENEKLKKDLEQAKLDLELSFSRGKEDARLDTIKEFLNSPVLDAITWSRFSGILQTTFFKGVQQLIAADAIPDKMAEYVNHMNILKNWEGKDYKAQPSSSTDWKSHEFAHLVKEFGVPMHNPDLLELEVSRSSSSSEDDQEDDVEEDTNLDIEGSSEDNADGNNSCP